MLKRRKKPEDTVYMDILEWVGPIKKANLDLCVWVW